MAEKNQYNPDKTSGSEQGDQGKGHAANPSKLKRTGYPGRSVGSNGDEGYRTDTDLGHDDPDFQTGRTRVNR